MVAFRDQRLEEVVRVTGVGERREKDGVALTLLSVELYRDGVVAQFHIVQRRQAGAAGAFGLPQLAVAASDDRGTVYRERPYGGSGGGPDHGTVNWRMASAFAPAAPEDARMLVLRVDEVVWSTASGTELVESERTAGPWEFVVPLAQG
jgi:hypothetical protein